MNLGRWSDLQVGEWHAGTTVSVERRRHTRPVHTFELVGGRGHGMRFHLSPDTKAIAIPVVRHREPVFGSEDQMFVSPETHISSETYRRNGHTNTGFPALVFQEDG